MNKSKYRIIAFNSAPRTGKDTVANQLKRYINTYGSDGVSRVQLSLPMRIATYALLGLTYDEAHYERFKDTPQPMFSGRTIRQAMIALSEEHIKPAYGKKFWCKSALTHQKADVIIISDLGFYEELDYLNKTFGVLDTLVVKLTRKKTTWDGDSRQDLWPQGQTLSVDNNESIDKAVKEIFDHITS